MTSNSGTGQQGVKVLDQLEKGERSPSIRGHSANPRFKKRADSPEEWSDQEEVDEETVKRRINLFVVSHDTDRRKCHSADSRLLLKNSRSIKELGSEKSKKKKKKKTTEDKKASKSGIFNAIRKLSAQKNKSRESRGGCTVEEISIFPEPYTDSSAEDEDEQYSKESQPEPQNPQRPPFMRRRSKSVDGLQVGSLVFRLNVKGTGTTGVSSTDVNTPRDSGCVHPNAPEICVTDD